MTLVNLSLGLDVPCVLAWAWAVLLTASSLYTSTIRSCFPAPPRPLPWGCRTCTYNTPAPLYVAVPVQYMYGCLTTALELLDLSHNAGGSEGARALAAAGAGGGRPLQTLHLCHNDVGTLAKAQLRAAALLRSGDLVL